MGRLQQAMTALTYWAQEWRLGISIDKCFVLNIGTAVCSSPIHQVVVS